jgi:MoaA/NifB/PqqE/SkfB family radical SAM enzyme
MGNDLRYFSKVVPSTNLKHVRLAIDDSCNLKCPSCRKGMIFHKEGPTFQRGIKLADKINEWLHQQQHSIQVHIGSDGDPFASHVYRHFMQKTPRTENINYSILTNGIMLKEFLPQIPHVMSNLTKLGVSIDGASAGTYEKLRLGGKWDKIIENLNYISSLKSQYGFEFVLQFVVQKDNYHEMIEMIGLASKYQANRLSLNKIEDWQVMNNWKEQNIFDQRHPLHSDFVDQFEKVIPFLNHEDRAPIVEAGQLYKRVNKK